jgi:hypothetical protein
MTLLRDMLWDGAKHFVESTHVEMVNVRDDPAVDDSGTAKFWSLVTVASKHQCSLPGSDRTGLPHAWPNVYSATSIFWWLSSTRMSVARFALHGDPWPTMESADPDTCFVEAMTDASLAKAPFQGGLYTSEFYDWRNADDVSQKASGSGPVVLFRREIALENPDASIWRMRRKVKGDDPKRVEEVTVEPLVLEDDLGFSINLLVERLPPASWQSARQSRIKQVMMTWPEVPCAYGIKKPKWMVIPHGPGIERRHFRMSLRTGEYNVTNDDTFSCLFVHTVQIMGDYRSGDLAKILIHLKQGNYPSDAKSMPSYYCGLSSDVNALSKLSCSNALGILGVGRLGRDLVVSPLL